MDNVTDSSQHHTDRSPHGLFGTSSIISNTSGDQNVVIDSNLFAGGAYSLDCPRDVKGVNYLVWNNHFSTRFKLTVGAFGPSDGLRVTRRKSGNVYHETGRPVNLE